MRADFLKTSRHPLTDLAGVSTTTVSRTRPVRLGTEAAELSCGSCHDPHYAVKATLPPPGAAAQARQIRNARGQTIAEYDLCFRCHGSATRAVTGLEDIERQLKPSNPSYHPVEATGKNPDVPSLIQPYKPQSIIACTDCHGSDNARGARGPHGSAFEPILKANFERSCGQPENAQQYALCYQCHNRNVVVSENPASFRYHKKHIVDEKASCHACHNSHGSEQYTHLIEFDTEVVSSNSKGQLRFTDLGARRGSCSLRCHDRDHDEEEY